MKKSIQNTSQKTAGPAGARYFNDAQLLTLRAALNLDGRNCGTVIEIARALYPEEMKNVIGTANRSPAYTRVRSSIEQGFTKMMKVLDEIIKLDSLPERDRKFFAELKKMHPKATSDDLFNIIMSVKSAGKGGPRPRPRKLNKCSLNKVNSTTKPTVTENCVQCKTRLTIRNRYDLCYSCQKEILDKALETDGRANPKTILDPHKR